MIERDDALLARLVSGESIPSRNRNPFLEAPLMSPDDLRLVADIHRAQNQALRKENHRLLGLLNDANLALRGEGDGAPGFRHVRAVVRAWLLGCDHSLGRWIDENPSAWALLALSALTAYALLH